MLRRHLMGLLVLPYAGASLFHHVHNAEFLADYPNMPLWITRALVYGAWLATTLVGVLGYFLLRKGAQVAGLAVLALYGAAAGFLLMSAAAVSMARSNPR